MTRKLVVKTMGLKSENFDKSISSEAFLFVSFQELGGRYFNTSEICSDSILFSVKF